MAMWKAFQLRQDMAVLLMPSAPFQDRAAPLKEDSCMDRPRQQVEQKIFAFCAMETAIRSDGERVEKLSTHMDRNWPRRFKLLGFLVR
jgi:hypothetical protein